METMQIAQPLTHNSSDDRASDSNVQSVYKELCRWISQSNSGTHGAGKVHDNLELRGEGSTRGIIAVKHIRQGEILVSLPANLAVSGSQQPKSYRGKDVSNWLRCIAAYYEARQRGVYFQPYLNSLPVKYESLLDWSKEEVKDFLGGTALGNLALKDQTNDVLETRFQEAVRPYLEHIGLVLSPKPLSAAAAAEELDTFREACMCVATRGFHLDQVALDGDTTTTYSGPFLLPFIDLLNHDPSRKCTTLRWDGDKECFIMEAERDISLNEEVYHSYGTSLTSSQLLKTFGFVSEKAIDAAARGVTTGPQVTVAGIAKKELLSACMAVAESTIPAEIISHMQDSNMSEEEMHWHLKFDMLGRDTSFLPDNFLISCLDPLSDELVTVCSALLLPQDVYIEMVQSGADLLDRSLLHDYFLCKLVCQSILFAITKKFEDYKSFRVPEIEAIVDDKAFLKSIQRKPNLQRAAFGLTIRLEEKACLAALRSEIFSISDAIGGPDLVTDIIFRVSSDSENKNFDVAGPAEKKPKLGL